MLTKFSELAIPFGRLALDPEGDGIQTRPLKSRILIMPRTMTRACVSPKQ